MVISFKLCAVLGQPSLSQPSRKLPIRIVPPRASPRSPRWRPSGRPSPARPSGRPLRFLAPGLPTTGRSRCGDFELTMSNGSVIWPSTCLFLRIEITRTDRALPRDLRRSILGIMMIIMIIMIIMMTIMIIIMILRLIVVIATITIITIMIMASQGRRSSVRSQASRSEPRNPGTAACIGRNMPLCEFKAPESGTFPQIVISETLQGTFWLCSFIVFWTVPQLSGFLTCAFGRGKGRMSKWEGRPCSRCLAFCSHVYGTYFPRNLSTPAVPPHFPPSDAQCAT